MACHGMSCVSHIENAPKRRLFRETMVEFDACNWIIHWSSQVLARAHAQGPKLDRRAHGAISLNSCILCQWRKFCIGWYAMVRGWCKSWFDGNNSRLIWVETHNQLSMLPRGIGSIEYHSFVRRWIQLSIYIRLPKLSWRLLSFIAYMIFLRPLSDHKLKLCLWMLCKSRLFWI